MSGPESLKLRTLVALDEQPGGVFIGYPIMEPKWTAMGKREDVLAELRLFLETELAGQPAEVVSRFNLPAGSEGRTTLVPLSRAELPKRLMKLPPVEVPCVIIPHEGAHWVVVLPLQHTFFVKRGEDPLVATGEEVSRLVAAEQRSARQWLTLLPSTRHRVVGLEFELDTSGAAEARTATLSRRVEKRMAQRHALKVLGEIGRPLHGRGHAMGPPVVGHEQARASLRSLLASDTRSSLALVGEELVGKSAAFRAWLEATRGGEDARFVFATSGAQLIAGQSGLGQWQARLQRVMDAAERLDAVLYFDNLGDLFGDKAGSYVDLAGGMKRYLDEGRVRIVGEITADALDDVRTKDPSFATLLHTVRVEPGDRDGAAEVLRARLPYDRKRDDSAPLPDPEALEAILDVASRFLPYHPFPGKAVRLYEDVVATVERSSYGDGRKSIGASEVYRVFSRASGVPRFLLEAAHPLRTDDLRERFRRRLVGQREAVNRVVETLAVMKAGLAPGDRPLASFLFVGPTGVGKTELARALTETLFGSEDRLVRFDMSEYSDPLAAERLIRGTQDREGLLTREVRRRPFGVVLLDEIEKADPAVFDLLLQVCGEGRLTDARGRTAYFHNTVLIMTSNLGASHGNKVPLGVGAKPEDERDRYVRAVEATFRPEMVNRIDRIIPFGALVPAELEHVARLLVDKLARRRGILDLGVTLQVTDEAITRLAVDGHAPEYGARAMRRHVDTAVAAPLATLLGPFGDRAEDGLVIVSRTGEDTPQSKGPDARKLAELTQGSLTLRAYRRGTSRDADEGFSGLFALGALRRHATTCMDLPTIDELTERLKMLNAQLNTGRASGANGDRMRREQAELTVSLGALRDIVDDISAAEALQLSAVLEGADGFDRQGADEFRGAFDVALAQVMLDTQRLNRGAILVQEMDGGRSLDDYLGSLIAQAEQRGWRVLAYLPRDIDPKQPMTTDDKGWPSNLPYAPAIGPAQLQTLLSAPDRQRMRCVIELVGAYAGNVLFFEAGLHRWRRKVGERFGLAHHSNAVVGLRERVTHEALRNAKPLPLLSSAVLGKLASVRTVDTEQNTVAAPTGRVEDVTPDTYWIEWERIVVRTLIAQDRAQGLEVPRLGEER